ncbi:hypothetical protein [Pseudoalteromonas sp. MTN2-4]|uniref:hypothetical protein n=1 Tax=Pseudoalteromonas sp. MTN2-4 TaxID=3056555 RepID=UPI0036F19873
MTSIGLGVLNIGLIVIVLLGLVLMKIDVADIVFSILSGSIVALVFSTLASYKGISKWKVGVISSFTILGSIVAWFIALIFLKITTLSLYGTTAMVFDLFIGMIGATFVAVASVEKFENKAQV